MPNFPMELFEHTLMVGGASKFLEYYSRGENKIKATQLRLSMKWTIDTFAIQDCTRIAQFLQRGAFHKDTSGNFNEEI